MCPLRRDPKVDGVLELLEAIFLGVVQGLTEFLPVSSSGHLLLSQYFLGMDQGRFGLSFDAAIHTGTVLAVVWFFWGDILSMARALLRSLPRPDFSDAERIGITLITSPIRFMEHSLSLGADMY